MRVKIRLTTAMLGTAPKDADVYAKYIQTKVGQVKPSDVQVPLTADEEMELVNGTENAGWTGFRSDSDGLVIPAYMIKGFLKEAGATLKDALKVVALGSRITQCVFITPNIVHLGKTEPDGVIERPLRAQTMQGPRVSLARSDYVDAGTEIEFSVKWLPHPKVKDWRQVIITLLAYGSLKGLGQWRSGGYGSFEIVSIDGEPVSSAEYIEPLMEGVEV